MNLLDLDRDKAHKHIGCLANEAFLLTPNICYYLALLYTLYFLRFVQTDKLMLTKFQLRMVLKFMVYRAI